jgi:putative membrane protein
MMNNDFSTPQRQNLLGVLVYFIKNGRALISLLIALIATAGEFENGTLYLTLGMVFFTILVLLISYLQYLNFTFHIENGEVIIHHGVIFKEKRIIPFERIQSVHLHQNFIQQILGLVGLKIDSAGSQQKELEISALDEKTARAFQDAVQEQPDKSEEAIAEKTNQDIRTELLSLNVSDLFKVGLTENHLRSGLFAIAVVFGYYQQFSHYLEGYLADYVSTEIEDYVPQLIRMGMILVVTGLVTFIVISIFLSLARTILKFFNFNAWLEKDIIGLSSGLLKKIEYRLPVSKVQYLVWGSNPLRKILGFKSILVKQAQPQRSGRRAQQVIEIPACYDKQSEALEEVVFGRRIYPGKNLVRANVIPYMLISFYISAAIAATITIAAYFSSQTFLWPVLLLVPVVVFLAYKYGKSVVIDIQDDVVVVNKGWIFPQRFVLPLYKAQSVSFVQSIFLKRRKLATCIFYTASGSVSMRFLPEDTVKLLYNFILFRTESYRGSWM